MFGLELIFDVVKLIFTKRRVDIDILFRHWHLLIYNQRYILIMIRDHIPYHCQCQFFREENIISINSRRLINTILDKKTCKGKLRRGDLNESMSFRLSDVSPTVILPTKFCLLRRFAYVVLPNVVLPNVISPNVQVCQKKPKKNLT